MVPLTTTYLETFSCVCSDISNLAHKVGGGFTFDLRYKNREKYELSVKCLILVWRFLVASSE